MKYYFNHKFKNFKRFFKEARKGFTLVETLITVGVLAILLAVSIPSVITIQKSLKMQEFDDIARQIFLAAQSELTEMKSSGRLETFRKELNVTAYSNQNLGTLNKRPSDYEKVDAGFQDDLKWKDFYYLNATDPVMEKHIIRKVSSLGAYLEGGSFIVELNPETSDVYGAFYLSKPGITYNDILKLPNRGRDGRVAAQIGYYGGEAGSSASSTLPANFLPTIDIVNAEDLYIKFECSNLQSILRTQGFLKLTITATDENGSAVEGGSDWETTLTGGTHFFIDATGSTSCNILLDGMRQNESFEEITGGKLKAGDNIKITAKLEYDNGRDPVVTGVAAEQTVNSLFAAKNEVGGVTKIDIAYLRHLNNLRSSIYKEANVPTGEIVLNQSFDIDFDVTNWDNASIMPNKLKPSLTRFVAITNKALLERNVGAATTYKGNGNSLLNFPLAAPTEATIPAVNVGLFASAKNMTFEGMRMIDFSLKGAYSSAGMLVGSLTGGKVIDVRAHLSTEGADGRPHGTNMPDRLIKYSIAAQSNVGGLIGLTEGTTEIEGSFAAVPINAVRNVGGIVGSFAGGTITNSYGSGNIIATSYAGGLSGLISGTATVSNCYSTSNITANIHAGGLVGRTAGTASTFVKGRAYGLVIKADKTVDNATSGGFVGSQASNNIYTDCRYLQQGSYNNYDLAVSKNYGTATGYNDKLLAPSPNSVTNSHPYMLELFGKIFPFPLIITGTGTNEKLIPHYGDWVEGTTMQTSLVYYERYKNGEYGYYAKTSLSTIGGSDEEAAANMWEINTLRDEYCVEDGYALMTIFKLSNFTYELENGAPQTVTAVEDIADTGTNKAPLIQSNVTVEFTKGDLSQTIANARVYQLPFRLQVAERGTNIKNFFLKLNINGYVGDKKVIDNFNFYYCPDFAKNAVNPEIGNTHIDVYPNDPTGENNPVYVRSPRQLNGLSRYYYYWNDQNNGGKKFYFLQETELDYGEYVTNYCGVTYDLMDTSRSNPYRNRPIGRPNDDGGGQFRNIYDGQSNEIIDYCCETDETGEYSSQFTGLFGEVRKGTLKNIILKASVPGDETKDSSAYVKSHFNDRDKDSTYVSSGTGALVGLVYVDQKEEHDSSAATVSNCFVSGYDVEVTTSNSPHREHAVGGLAGYNFGVIENSSANSKTVVANPKYHGNTSYLGGLVGSLNGKGSIVNCYAGGVLKNSANNVNVAGLVGGFNGIYGYGNDDPKKRHQRVENSYSHCTWNKDNLKNGTFYPCVPKVDQFDIKNCYYLTNSVDPIITKSFDKENDPSEGKDAMELRQMASTSLSTELSDFGKADITHPWSIKGKHYPFPAIVKNKGGQRVHYGDWYESRVVTPSSIFVYYEKYHDDKGAESFGYQFVETAGIKELNDNLKDNTFEIIEAGYGVLVLDKADSLAKVWINGKEVAAGDFLNYTGTYTAASGDKYKLLSISNSDVLGKAEGTIPNVILSYNEIKDSVVSEKIDQKLYVNFSFAATVSLKPLISTKDSPTQVRTERQLRKLNGLSVGYYKMTHNIPIENIGATPTGNLKNEGYTFDGGYVAGGGGIEYSYFKEPTRWFGKNGNYIFGLKAPLFYDNRGTVQNVALLGVNVQDDYTAALVVNNGGSSNVIINNCFAQGDVTGNRIAGGLVYSNSGTIQNSYFSGKVTAVSQAAGFVYENSASISNCYTVGEVTSLSSVNASGFVDTNVANISNSYSAMSVNGGGNRYGFASSRNNGVFNHCYWLRATGRNINKDLVVKDSKGINLNYTLFGNSANGGLLSKINEGEVWKLKGTAYPLDASLSGNPYPFPSLISQDFYGDWPE